MNDLLIEPQIPVFKPLIEREEIAAAVESLERGWLGMGSYVEQFEARVAAVCEIDKASNRHVVAVSTGFAAIHLSLLMMGVGPGDEVITPSLNFTADFQAIKACGASPVFIDVDKDTLCIDAEKIEELISEKTKCIIAMDYDVFICDHDELSVVACRHNIPILHDAAHSFGSSYKGVPIGHQHSYTIFSFDPVKSITCIDGGVIIVQGVENVERLQAKRLLGMTQPATTMYTNSRAWTYDVNELGFRYHMANTHAAIGIAQIDKIVEIRTSRQASCQQYCDELSSLDWITAPNVDFSLLNPFLYFIRILNGKRAELREHMREKGVDVGVHWQPGHTFTYFKDCRAGSLGVTNRVAEEILSLPLHSKMSSKDVSRVINAIKSFGG
jgi:dTDP-4-amino-4,6-dideoxygalactose transaminase